MKYISEKSQRTIIDLVIVLAIALAFATFNLFVNISDRLHMYLLEVRKMPQIDFLINLIFLLILGLVLALYCRWRRAYQREQELQNILESINPDVLLVVDRGRTIRFANDTIEAMFGYSPYEVIGEQLDMLFALTEENRGLTTRIYTHLRDKGFFVGTAIGLRKDGSMFPLEIIEGELKRDGGGVVVLLRDITERKRAQDALNFRLRFEKLLASISTRFINISPEQIDVEIMNSLKALSQFLYADRAYFYTYDKPAHRFTKVFEWLNSKFEKFPAAKEEIDIADYPEIMKKVLRQKDLYLPEVSSAPEKIREEIHRFEDKGVASLVWIPIIYGGSLVGIVGFDSFHLALELGDEDLGLIRMFGEIIVNAIKRKKRELELRHKTAELERSNKELEQFAYIASHDLQGPLRKIMGYINLIRRRYADTIDPNAAEFLDYIARSAQKMRDLITDLLTYSRAGNRPLHKEPVDTEQILLDVLGNLQDEIRQTGAVIDYSSLPEVMADPVQLEQLFYNLLSNAIKFHGDKPPRVRISAREVNGFWEFAISDNGIGIPPQFHNRIFVIFQRLHSEDKYPGTGIGLAICKKIVERHGGQIWVESEPGQGSTFYFTLPAGKNHDNHDVPERPVPAATG